MRQIEEARLSATFQRALLVLTEAPIMSDEVEVEEDLGPVNVRMKLVPELEDSQFDIEIIQDDFGDRASDDEDAEEEAKEEASHPPKRKENTVVEGERKGKYVQ
jgi:hypothetical protein